jgi:hypothetical protein
VKLSASDMPTIITNAALTSKYSNKTICGP